MRSRFRIHMLQKRRFITTRLQWAMIGLTSLIALNTTLYWSLNQDAVVPLPDNDVSDFPIRQKVISIDNNWELPGEPHWEVIDPVEETPLKPAQEERHTVKDVSLAKRKPQTLKSHQKRVVSTDRQNVRYITLKAPIQEQDSSKFAKKQNVSDKTKPDLLQMRTLHLQKPSPESRVTPKINNYNLNKPTTAKVKMKTNNMKSIESPKVVMGHVTYRSNLSLAGGRNRQLSSRVQSLRGSMASRGSIPHSTKPAPGSITGNIRYYSKPPWFSNEDIQTLRLLAEEEIRDILNLPSNLGDHRKAALFRAPVRIFESGANERQGDLGNLLGKCKLRDACAMVLPANHVHEVIAFHIDRIFRFNRSLPCVARNLPEDFRISKGTGNIRDPIYPMTAFDASIHMAQDVLFWSKDKLQHCAKKFDFSNSDLDCEGTTPDEISGLAMFDFLLQITYRLDRYCCGLALSDRPLSCGQLSTGIAPGTCGPSDHSLGRIYHRGIGKYRRLVFTPNVVNLNVPSGRLDYLILDGIESFPEHAVSVLRSGKFRQMLLQSLFIDKVYWDGLGGRKAIEDILDVMEKRGKMFLKYLADKKFNKRT